MHKKIFLFEIFLSLLFNYVISKSSVIIHYPNSIFISHSNWREMKAIYDPKLTKSDEYLKVGRSQDREDVWIYENWFYGMTNGTILESGALNGETFSNSLMFERFSSWFTIHIEADPKNFHGLKQSRTNSLNIHAALCSEPKVLHFTQDQNNAINGFIEFMNPMFVQMWHPKLAQNPELIQNLPTILCLPVKNLLKEIHVKHIDVWMLDVEGAELDVLKGVDWNQVSISTIVMECDSRGNDKDKLKTDLLVANDYTCKVIERNCFCHHKTFQPSVSPPEKMQWKSLRLKEGGNPELLG